MKLFSNEHLFNHSWDLVSAANWIKYPNEITQHVIHVDYLSRHLDPQTGILRTERLLTCKQNVPEFVTRCIGGTRETFVYEVSETDARNRTLTLRARNLSMAHLMTVEETCTYTPSAHDSSQTFFKQEAQITSFQGFSYIRNTLEDFCLERFRSNASKGRAALENVLQRICQETKEAVASCKEFLPSGNGSGAPGISSAEEAMS